MYQIKTLHTLNLHHVICLIYFNQEKKRTSQIKVPWKKDLGLPHSTIWRTTGLVRRRNSESPTSPRPPFPSREASMESILTLSWSSKSTIWDLGPCSCMEGSNIRVRNFSHHPPSPVVFKLDLQSLALSVDIGWQESQSLMRLRCLCWVN